MEEIIKVNKARLAILIGNNGETKKELEKKCKVSLDIDSNLGEIIISSDNYFNIYKSKKIINAISRGFSPKNALILLNDDYTIEILHLKDYTNKDEKRQQQLKGRVIGREGKFKSFVEKRFGCYLAIYGKTVSIISKNKDINNIVEVIETILNGAKHTSALKLIKKYTSPLRNYKKNFVDNKGDSNIDDISF
jgi:ribosomal RNA assembly protein